MKGEYNLERILKLVATFILISSFLVVPASAHAGRTDSNGGHWDRETGVYHYHHGYPAHPHYDMDGDGVIDCPYDFDDQTGQNSGNPSNNSGSGSSSKKQYASEYEEGYDAGSQYGYQKGYEEGHTEGYEEGAADKEAEAKAEIADMQSEIDDLVAEAEKQAFANAFWTFALLGIPLVVVAALSLVSGSHSREIADYKAKLQEMKHEIQSERNKAAILRANPNATLPDGIPEGVSLKFKCIPIKGRVSKTYPYGDYTVFLSASGKKFHRRYNCSNATKVAHFFQLGDGFEPCQRCVNEVVYGEALPEWWFQILKDISPEDIPKMRKPKEPSPKRETSEEHKEEPPKKYGPVSEPEEYKVDSSFIKTIAYRDEQLFVTMQNGTYCYYDVPESVFREFLAAQSKGKFFHERINGKYPYY